MRRIHVVAFKMAPNPPKGTGPGVYTVTDPFGTGTVSKTGPAFLEVQFSDLIGNGLTVRLAGPV